MITRRKLFGLLAGLPFVKALPDSCVVADFSDLANTSPVVIGEMWAGLDMAPNLDATSYITLTWDAVPDATHYVICKRPKA